MPTQELENASLLPAELSKNGQTLNHSETILQAQTPSETASQLLWELMRTVIGLQNQVPPLQPIARDGSLPLSFPQERLWFLEQLESGSSAYNIPFAYQITGSLNVSVLEQSLNEVLRRHEALRTTFAIEGRAVQVIVPSLNLNLAIVDLRQLPETERSIQVLQLATKEAKRPFDLSCEPLLRAALLQLSADEHVLILTIHHIVFDGWSESVLFCELAALYAAFSTDQPSPLTALPIQYADFAVWQRQWLQGEFLEALLSYWKQQLSGICELQLPTDRPRPAVPTRRSAYQKLVLSQELTAALKALSSQEGVTLFTTLLAAFKVLLHHYTQQDDIFVCSPIANRNRYELKELIGYFVNLLVLRSDLSGGPSFQELLRRVRQVVSGAYAHQDLPVQLLVNYIDSIQLSLSQVMFVLQNTPSQVLQLPGLTVSPLDIDSETTADFDLFLSMVEEAGTLTGMLKYNTDLFDAATINRMLSHFQTILTNIVANPVQPLSLLLPLSAADKQQLLNCRAKPKPELLRSERYRVYVAPRNKLELQLTKILQQVLGIEPISVTDNFFELGGESLLALSLFTQIEKIFAKNLPLSTLLQAPTVEQLAAVLSQEEELVSWSSIVPIQLSGSKPPFFCVHGLYGSILVFKLLAHHLGPEQPFYGLQARGLDGKQAPFSRVEDMAAHYIKEIRSIQPQGPYFLGGYSFGGIVAFEMAQQLHKQGQKVAFLGLLDVYGPGCFKRLSFREKLSRHWRNLLRFGLIHVLKMIKGRLKLVCKQFAFKLHLSLGRPLPYALRRLTVKEPHSRAQRDYVPQPYPGQVTLFQASNPLAQHWYYEPDMPTPDDWYNRDPQHGWGRLTGELEIHDVSGEHLTMLQENHVESLAEKLRVCLDKANSSENEKYSNGKY